MPFKSQAQRRFFYAKASEGGKEGKKFRKYLAEMEAKTPKGKKLPERVKTASIFSRFFTRRTPSQQAEQLLKKTKKIRSSVKTPKVSVPTGPEIVLPKPPTSPSRQRAIEQLREMKKSASQVVFEAGFFSEAEKIAKEDSKADKVIKSLPGIGAIIGGAAGAASPKMFNPSGMFPEYIKSVGLRSAKGRALSALLGAGVVSGLGWTVPALKDLKDVAEGK